VNSVANKKETKNREKQSIRRAQEMGIKKWKSIRVKTISGQKTDRMAATHQKRL
jgi:hypothetical protein